MTSITGFAAVTASCFLALSFSFARAAEALKYDCSQMAQDIGAPATEMKAAPDEGWQHGPEEARLVCSWYTDSSVKALEGQGLSREDYKDLGVLTAQVVVYANPLDRSSAAMMNTAHDVPSGLAPDGSWLFAFKAPEMDAKLGILPPELMFEGLGTSVGYGNGFVTNTGTGSALSIGWSIEAAARIMTKAEKAR